jgi:signal transduction histidine kinase
MPTTHSRADLLSLPVLKEQPWQSADAELQTRRAAIQRELRRAQLASKGVLLFTFVLAVIAVWLAHHSYGQTRKVAEASARLATEQARVEEALWQSQVAHARAVLEGSKPGARMEALQAIGQAAKRRASPELRDEAIAALSLPDVGADETFREFIPETLGSEQRDPTRLSIDPSLKYITRSHHDGTVQCAGFEDGKILWELRGIGKVAKGPVVWSPDSEYLATQHEDRLSVHRWKQQECIFETSCGISPGMHMPVAFSRDSTKLFAWVKGAGCLYDLGTGQEIARLPQFEVLYHAAFHPHNPWVSLSTGKAIEIWNYITRRRVVTLQPRDYSIQFNHHAWRDDGLALAAGGQDKEVYVWDATTFHDETIRWHTLRGHTLPVIYVAFSHSGDTLISSSLSRETRWWSPYPWLGQSLRHLSHGYGVQFGPGDQKLALLRPSQGVSLRRVAAQPSMQRLAGPVGIGAQLSDGRFSPDSRWLACVNMDGLFVWDMTSNWVVARGKAFDGRSVLFRPDGREIITSGTSGVRRWPWLVTTNAEGKISAQLGEPTLVPVPAEAKPIKVAIDHSGNRLLVGGNNGSAYLYDLEKETSPLVLSTQRGLDTLAFSPDGKRIATGTWDGVGVRIWDAFTGKRLQDIPSLDADVGYTADGQWLVISSVSKHSFWNTSSNAVLKSIAREEGEQNVGRLAFLPDGKTVAWNHSFSSVQLVAIDSLRVLANFTVPSERKIEWLRSSPDGRWLAVLAGRVYLYDLHQLQRELLALGLDWKKTFEPSALAGAGPISLGDDPAPRFLLAAGSASGSLVMLIMGGLVLALAMGGLTQRYHRRLLTSYFELETMAVRRNEALIQAQTELQHSHKMQALGTLAAGVAHDFNNLLSVIGMSNELTAERTKGDADLEENTQLVNQSVAQGRAVVRSLLGHSSESVERTSFSVNEAVRETAVLLRQQFLQGIQLHLALDTPTGKVTAVRSRLDQILLNLIVNAAEAMGDKGELHLSVTRISMLPASLVVRPRPAGAWIEVAVADNGPGMTPEIKARIFEPFFTTKNTLNRHGTGLGLSMVRSIAESEGFGIGLETGPGRGTTFRIFIPVETA